MAVFLFGEQLSDFTYFYVLELIKSFKKRTRLQSLFSHQNVQSASTRISPFPAFFCMLSRRPVFVNYPNVQFQKKSIPTPRKVIGNS